MKTIILSILAAGLLVSSSCTKTGPVGPQGAQGATGNANVIGSDHFIVSMWEQPVGTSYYSAEFEYADITADVASYGLVEVYKQYSDGSWTNLPDINGITSTVFNFSPGKAIIYVLNSNGSLPAYPGTIKFRFVVVPSSVKAANPNTNWKNYNEAIQAISKGTVSKNEL
ncbi:MAG: hypothetical protein H7257_03570 [Taibaiella sp.]|nr:hypothetical protein [Taibaiella sp.]